MHRPAPIDVVWFKRDLRVRDHAPLAAAAADPAPGGTVYLYVYEPELLAHPTHHPAHLRFVDAALAELRTDLCARGADLTLRVGAMPDVLARLHTELGPIRTLRSHQETGHAVSYARDRRVRAWCDAHGVAWSESVQDGVQRGLRHRDGWAQRWARAMAAPEVAVPERLPRTPDPDPGPRRTAAELGLAGDAMPDALPGGRQAAEARLDGFLRVRGREYTAAMASPVAGWEACSRVSADLAVGTLSLKVARQASEGRALEVAGWDPVWARSLRSFERRLAWRSHFMQKLESEPAIEHRATNRALDDLRADGWDEARFAAWRDGQTGYPLIDAGMRALAAGGWVNFRLRATLVSFATYHLWLDWRPVATELARRFLDYEPGIHYPQVHMQSGVTGVNTIR
ncbi:MAG: FAD-binding domain-containing protein, partial [Trueperaceae bacterium]